MGSDRNTGQYAKRFFTRTVPIIYFFTAHKYLDWVLQIIFENKAAPYTATLLTTLLQLAAGCLKDIEKHTPPPS